jgi:hypothetical protein
MSSLCPKCGLEHRGWVTCAKARFDAGMVVHKPEPMANSMANTPKDMANREIGVANSMANDSQGMANTYKYRDSEKRREYMKGYMRKRRLK